MVSENDMLGRYRLQRRLGVLVGVAVLVIVAVLMSRRTPQEGGTRLAPGFDTAFAMPTSDRDQYGSPVVTRDGEALDPQTGRSYEICLDLGTRQERFLWWQKQVHVTMEFVLIPAGEFMMGSPDNEKDRGRSEGPVHRVRISKPFYMGKYEVTQAACDAVMGRNRSRFKGSSNPVETVSWDDCVAFCKKVSESAGVEVRLPTEAQWEYACRAGTQTRFSFGDDLNHGQLGEYAWYGSNSGSKTHPVGEKKPNSWGLYDMHGNVCEWCQDWHHSYSSGSTADPTGPSNGVFRMLRGGSWFISDYVLRSSVRSWTSPDYTYTYLGLRCVLAVR